MTLRTDIFVKICLRSHMYTCITHAQTQRYLKTLNLFWFLRFLCNPGTVCHLYWRVLKHFENIILLFFDAWFVSVVFGCCYGIVFILDIITNICTIFTYLYARSVQKRHTKKLVMLSTFVMHIFVTFKIHSKKYKDFSLYISCEKLYQTAFLFTGKALNWKLWVWFFFLVFYFLNLNLFVVLVVEVA